MAFDISKVSIDRKIAAASPVGFFVHFIEVGCRGLLCDSAALPAQVERINDLAGLSSVPRKLLLQNRQS